MSEELLVRHGAPTLAGMKTGSLFSCACGDAAALRGDKGQRTYLQRSHAGLSAGRNNALVNLGIRIR